MKKLMLVVAFAGVASFAFAQKPTSGSITTEIGLSSVLGTPVTAANPAGVPQGVLKGRYFLSDDMAVRASFGLGMTSKKEITSLGGGGGAPDEETTTKTTGFALGVGIEKHMAGTSKLSPYVGAELGFGIAGGSSEVTNAGNVSGTTVKTTGGNMTNLSLNAMIGADYWIVEKVYIGAELGINVFGSSSISDTETEITGVTPNAITPGSKTSGFGINPAALGMVRIGLMF